MLQQDYTAPLYSVRQSRKESFGCVYELTEPDEETPDRSMTTGTFAGTLFDASGTRVGVATCTRVAAHAVLVEVGAAVFRLLRTGQYRLEVFYVSPASEREDLVAVLITLV